MSLNKQFTILVPLTLVLVTLLAYNFMSAQWSAPTGAPPTGNTDAPINTGGTPQVKTGGLSTGALSINGSLGVSSVNPLIYMSDTDGRPFWLYSNNSYFYLLTSRDADPNTIESPYPMTMFADNNPANDYVYFNNQVRAAEYCDNGGGNCSTAAEMKGGLTCQNIQSPAFELKTGERPADGNRYMVVPESTSARCIQLGYDFGYPLATYEQLQPDSSGWCGFGNARTAFWAGNFNANASWKTTGACVPRAVSEAICCSL